MYGELLLIEDEDSIREIITDKLKAAGYHLRIHESADPMKALDLFHKNKERISFVICDYFLPIQNGDDLCQIIKSHKLDIKVFCLTGGTIDKSKPMIDFDRVFFKPYISFSILPKLAVTSIGFKF